MIIGVALAFLVGGHVARASDVTLTSRDGSVEVSGELLSYDGEFFRIDTKFGELTLDGSGVVCSGPDCPDPGGYVADITLSGAPDMGAVLIPSLLESFATRKDLELRQTLRNDQQAAYQLSERASGRLVARITFNFTSSEEAFADLIADEADIALSLREVTPAEVDLARDADLGDLGAPNRSRIVALDGLVPLVGVANPVAQIRMLDLAAVFAGDITSWAELGGEDAPIEMHLRNDRSGQVQAFERQVMQGMGKALSPAIRRHDSNAALSAAVAESPFALGIGSFSDMGNATPLLVTGPCRFSEEATETGIKTEDYPLTAPLFAYLPARRLPRIAREFMTYIASPAAQPVIRRAGFVDQFPAAIPFRNQGDRFANAIIRAGRETDLEELQRMVAILSGHSRLTVTFRFEGGATALDAQSRSNVALLAEAIERGLFDGRSLLFAGFSDGEGAATANRRISRSRAEAVRDAVRAAVRAAEPSQLLMQVEAFGEAMPLACDEVEWGRQVNRRVEVWLEQGQR